MGRVGDSIAGVVERNFGDGALDHGGVDGEG